MPMPDTSIQDTPAQIVERLGIFSSREWNLAVSSESWWRSKTGTVFTQMKCCAFCGVCTFPRFHLPVHDPAFARLHSKNVDQRILNRSRRLVTSSPLTLKNAQR